MNISLILFLAVLLGACSLSQSGHQVRRYNIRSYRHNNYNGGRVLNLGLRKVAQGSALKAHRAVANQHLAAQKAALVAKGVLADSASQAAETADVAFATKHILVENLEHERAEANYLLEAELVQLQKASNAAATAARTAQKAVQQIQALAAVLKCAQKLVYQAAAASKDAQADLNSQNLMVVQATARLEAIERLLEELGAEFAATKEASSKAAAAARAALNVIHVGELAYDATEQFQDTPGVGRVTVREGRYQDVSKKNTKFRTTFNRH